MTKTTHDLATLFDILASKDSSDSFTNDLTGSWSDISVGTLDPSTWKYPETLTKPVDGAEAQIVSRPAHSGLETIINETIAS